MFQGGAQRSDTQKVGEASLTSIKYDGERRLMFPLPPDPTHTSISNMDTAAAVSAGFTTKPFSSSSVVDDATAAAIGAVGAVVGVSIDTGGNANPIQGEVVPPPAGAIAESDVVAQVPASATANINTNPAVNAVNAVNTVVVNQQQVQDANDIVREYLLDVRRQAPHDARRYHEACEIAFTRKPSSLQQSTDSLELARLSNAQCKVMLSVMNVTGCKNSCLAAKKYILACKMVQRQVSLQALFDITSRLGLVPAHEQRSDGGTLDSEVARIKSLPKTSAAAEPPRPGQLVTDLVNWARGDVPVFHDNDVIIGQPAITITSSPLDEVKSEDVLKKRVNRTRGNNAAEEERNVRRRRVTAGDLMAAGNNLHPDNEVFIKEAEAQSAGARAVQDTLKAIKDTEDVMNACTEDDADGRAFYKAVIETLRSKMATIIGMQRMG